MPAPPHATLRQVNQTLRAALLQLRPERKHCSSIKPADLAGILALLAQASECLRTHAPQWERTVAFQNELLEYRRNLEELKRLLPDLHVRLLAEKSRLEVRRAQLGRATDWATASKQTL